MSQAAASAASTIAAPSSLPGPAYGTGAAFAKPGPATTAHAGTPPPFAQSTGTAGSIGSAVFALIVVIGLILALAWLAKRMPGLGGTSNPALRIVGSLALGPRERVVVVAVGHSQLLLGVGAGGTRVLHALTEPLPVAAPSTPAFAQLLSQHFGKKA